MLPTHSRLYPGFKPTRLSGCVLWLDAAKGITLNSTTVSQWDDQSGAGNHVAQGTAASQPTYTANSLIIPGRPSLTFDGTADRLILNAFAAGFTGSDVPITVIAVASHTGVASSTSLMSFGNSGGTTQFMAFQKISAQPRLNRTDDAAAGLSVNGSATIATATPYVWSFVFTGTTASVVHNGLAGTLAGNSNVGTTTLNLFTIGALGRSSVAQFWAGDIFEVVIYNRALGTRERRAVERYLGRKYKIPTGISV